MKNIALAFFIFMPIVSSAQIITTVAGNGTGSFTGDGVSATATGIYNPYGVGMDSLGNIFVGDALNHRIRKINTSGIISTIAGTGVAGYNGDGILATNAQLNFAHGMAVNREGVIVIADMSNHRIRSIQSESGGLINTIGGTGAVGFSGDGGPAVSATMNNPQGIFWDASYNVFFGDSHNNRVRKINSTGIINTIAGSGIMGYGGDGGPATLAKLYWPAGVTADSVGNIYIADMYNHRIRKVDTAGIITTVAGTGTMGYSGDGGPATMANLKYPKGLYVDRVGNIIFTDTDNQYLRKINTTTGIITSIAGTGVVGFAGDGGPATLARLNFSQGVYVDNDGNIYVGDCLNNRIRKINCVPPVAGTISGADTVCMGSTITLTASASGGAWSSSNPHASITSAGIVTGASVGLDTIKYTVINSCAAVGVSHPVYVKPCVSTSTYLFTNEAKIYPNPATNKLTINNSDKVNNIVIVNILGQTAYSHEHYTAQMMIDIANLPNGVYYVKVNGIPAGEFVKQ